MNVGLTATCIVNKTHGSGIRYHQRATRIEQIDYWLASELCAITKPVKPAPEIKNLRFEVSIFPFLPLNTGYISVINNCSNCFVYPWVSHASAKLPRIADSVSSSLVRVGSQK